VEVLETDFSPLKVWREAEEASSVCWKPGSIAMSVRLAI
jgi:hypothetical protein